MSTIIGIHFGGHDSSVALVKNGKILFAMEEEKFTGIKAIWTTWQKPQRGLEFIKNKFNIDLDNADHIVFANPRHFIMEEEMSLNQKEKVTSYSHHKCHALGAYFTSGFEGKTIALSHDGQGNRSRGKIYLCDNGEYEEVHSTLIPQTASLAGLWGRFTMLFGWTMLKDEGKVVGLAPHGKFNERVYKHLKNSFKYNGDLSFGPPNFEALFDYIFNHMMWTENFFKSYENRCDTAYTLQVFTEEMMGLLLKDIHKKYPEYRNITFSGGLFANVKLNQFINELGYFDNIYIHPSMGDGGLALGAALCKANELGEVEKPLRLDNVFFGNSYTSTDWLYQIAKYNHKLKYEPMTYERVAELIHEGNVVGVFMGATEYGPRALGNRSIVVRPTDPDTHKKLNEKLRRTEIMPFAPAVLSERLNEVFYADKSLYSAEFMTLCYNTREEWLDKIPAVVHKEDGTARPQNVIKEKNPTFHRIIEEYSKLSGVPVVLNTSFNAHGEPINNYIHQVLKHLLDDSVDYIVTEDYIINKI